MRVRARPPVLNYSYADRATGRSRCGIIVVGCMALLQATWFAPDLSGAGVVFRFRPGSPELSSACVSENVEIGPFLDQRELAARGPGGWGLRSPYAAEFGGAVSTMRSDGIAPANQPLGPRLTVEAWFRATEIHASTSLLTNQAPSREGFSLGLADGVPFFELVEGARVFRVQATGSLAPGEDHWLGATVLYDGSGTLYLTLYLDGRQLAESAVDAVFPSPYALNAPFYVGTRAEGHPLTPTLTGEFTGLLYVAVVRDYVANPVYLSSGAPFDGGEYFGLPAYHDYSLEDFHLPMDQRIDTAPVEVRDRFFLPYANDEFIPQGTATRVEQDGSSEVSLVYISYYHRTREGVIQTQRSIVAEIDAANGHVRRTFRLRGQLEYSHAGGVAFAGGALFISSAGFLERYPVPPYEGPGGPKYLDLPPDPSGSIPVESKASFVSSFEDTLWVGDWRTSSDVAPFLYTYPLKPDGRPESAPSEIFALPRNIQGVDLFRHNGRTYVFLSRNRNRTEAEVLRYRRELLDRNVVVAADTSVTMPYGIEDLSFFPDGTLWTNSESGTVYYQRNDTNPWQVFYPFLYSLPAQILLPGASSIGVESPPWGSGIEFYSYPNPLRDSAGITVDLPAGQYARVFVTDLLGRTSARLADGVLAAGKNYWQWDASRLAPGVYFVVLESPSGRLVRPVVVIR